MMNSTKAEKGVSGNHKTIRFEKNFTAIFSAQGMNLSEAAQ